MTAPHLDNAILITQIIGSFDEQQHHGHQPHGDIDVVEIEWFEATRKIMRKTSQQGIEIAFRLFSEGQTLQHNDLIYNQQDLTIIIHIKPCPTIVLRPQDLATMGKVCYEIGNKHAPLFMDGDELLMPEDIPLFRWLEATGYQPVMENRRLNHILRSNSHSHGEDAHGHTAHKSHPKAPAWTERLGKKGHP